MTTNGKSLTIDEILASEDVEVQRVDTPAWGGHVYVRTVTADKRDAFDMSCQDGKLIGVRARFVGACLCDSEGKFLSPSELQIQALGRKSAAVMDQVFEVCQRINAMLPQDVERLEKNSPAEAVNDSG